MSLGKLYLIPNVISSDTENQTIPVGVIEIILRLRYFIVEDIRTARRYLRKIGFTADFDTQVQFFELNKHTHLSDLDSYLNPLFSGDDMGILSESGLPCIADPGNVIVEKAQNLNVKIVPLVGPSSIFLALMASGFNGQNFAFNGYLPINDKDRKQKIKELEVKILRDNQTQIFIETPYRNQQIFEAILSACQSSLRLCIASDVSGKSENIRTMSIAEWRFSGKKLGKVNMIFLLYK
ncbi:MAG: SAM-dependent methyltransferase [Bacteroidales bacterium]|nr:SAM-dependent methyltransferase [Bacteroidales bacterium]